MLTDLTISIPTYNRSGRLAWLLGEIDRSVPETVSVAIVNDGSTDDTQQVIESFVRHAKRNVHHSINTPNQGVDESIRRAAALARTKYVWLMGDDDAFDSELLGELPKIFAAYPSLGLVYFNYRGWLPDLSKPTTPPIIECTSNTYFQNGFGLLESVAAQISFLSSVCFQRDLFVEAVSKMPEKCKNSAIDHVWPILQILRAHPAFLVAETYIKCRTGDEDRGFNALEYLFHNLTYFKEEVFCSVSPLSKTTIKKRVLRGPLFSKIQIYRTSLLEEPVLRKHVLSNSFREFYAFPFFWIRVIPLLALPLSLVRLARWLRQGLKTQSKMEH